MQSMSTWVGSWSEMAIMGTLEKDDAWLYCASNVKWLRRASASSISTATTSLPFSFI